MARRSILPLRVFVELGISLDAIQRDPALVAKSLAAAQRDTADPQLAGLSP